MKIAMLPRSPWWRENPYLGLLETGLHQHGVETADDPNDGLGLRWLLDNRGRVSVLHLHWLEYHYERETHRQSRLALIRFGIKLTLARLLGYRIIWTVHNLEPHEARYPDLDRACWFLLSRVAHQVIVHCGDARRQVESRFGRKQNVHVIPLPNYVSLYPDVPGKPIARQQLGLDEKAKILLCIGAIRPYKGFQDAIVAFKQVPHSNVRLVIAGRPLNDEIEREIRSLAQDDQRIMTALKFIPESQIPIYLSAADAIVLPFRHIATSASAMLALSLRRPVVVPALGCLPELVTQGTGIVYDPTSPHALVNAMQASLESDLETMGRQAYERVAPFTPAFVSQRHLEVYTA